MQIACLICPLLLAGSAGWGQNFPGWEEHPGLYFYLVQPAPVWGTGKLSVERTTVRDRTAGKHALRLDFRASKTAPGIVVYRPPGAAVPDRGAFRALSLWVKGDGSKGVGVIGIGSGRDTDPRAQFLLKSTAWQPVRIDWDGFDPPVKSTEIRSIFFTVTPETKRPARYLIDRIELAMSTEAAILDDDIRKIGEAAAKLPDLPMPKDLTAFVTHREKLASFRARLKQKKPLRVLLIGDRVAQGAGLWNVPRGAMPRYLFWGVLKTELERKVPGTTVTPVFVDDPTHAALQFGAMLRRFRFDLVIVQFSVSSVVPGRRRFRRDVRKAEQDIFAACRREKVDVLALIIPPLQSRFKQTDEAAELLTEAARAGVPAADFGKLVSSRGKGLEGACYATPDQINAQGHLLAAKLLTSILTEP